ncbi:MAG: ABC transporter ATP-binding protein [Campylobacterota bacterium]|nr:ABC transporter ATP-binding protein [Campylobacterota bacterium]
MSIISIKDLSFGYEKDLVLENINLNVEKKDFLAIIGPNGGGKSTLLKLILGVNKIKTGHMKIYDKEITSTITSFGYVPQNTNINTDFPIKVLEVVLMGHVQSNKPLFGYGKKEKACAMGSLAKVGMEEFANKRIGSLSGGQRQRVMIARALCSNTDVLILDEPTSSIDVEGQRQIYDLLKVLNETITIIVVSHDISIILNYATKVAHVNKTLTFHDVKNKKEFGQNSSFDVSDEHFCEVELLQMLNDGSRKKSCKC